MTEHVGDGARGWAVPERDIDAMAELILLAAGDPRLRASMGSAARQYVIDGFSPRQVYPRPRRLIGIDES